MMRRNQVAVYDLFQYVPVHAHPLERVPISPMENQSLRERLLLKMTYAEGYHVANELVIAEVMAEVIHCQAEARMTEFPEEGSE
jgi:hypothetical protein